MAYFNNTDDANPYSTSSAYEELDPYPVLNQMSVGELADIPAFNTPTHGWDMYMIDHPGPTAGSPTGPLPTTSCEPAAPANSYTAQVDGYAQPIYPDNHWPAVDQQAQLCHSGFLSPNDSFASTLALEAPAVVSNSNSVSLDYWGMNESGPTTSTFCVQDMRPPYQSSPGPPRTGVIRTRRFQPYEMTRTRPNEHVNAEAGPSTIVSTFVPPPVPCIGPPTPQPSGGTSETMADAERSQKQTEEDKAPTTEGTRHPRGQGQPSLRTQEVTGKLRTLAQQQGGLPEPPSLNRALEVAADIIPKVRPLVYQEPRLRTGKGKRKEKRSRDADAEIARRDLERGLLQRLSRYFPLDQGRKKWSRSLLLSKVMEDLEGLPALPGPSDEPDP